MQEAHLVHRLERSLRSVNRDPSAFLRKLETVRAQAFQDAIERSQVAEAYATEPESPRDLGDSPVVEPKLPALNENRNIFAAVESEIADAHNYTLGLVSLSHVPISETATRFDSQESCPLQAFVVALAQYLSRDAYCLHLGGHQNGDRVVHSIPTGTDSIHVRFEGWEMSPFATLHRGGIDLDLQAQLQRMPQLKKQYPLVVLDLGPIETPQVMRYARICDSICFVIPSLGAMAPRRTVKSIRSLQKASVRVTGSWILRAA